MNAIKGVHQYSYSYQLIYANPECKWCTYEGPNMADLVSVCGNYAQPYVNIYLNWPVVTANPSYKFSDLFELKAGL